MITKQASGSAKIDPLMVAFKALALEGDHSSFAFKQSWADASSFSGDGASTGS